MTKFTSHNPTGRLLSLREKDPALAQQIEGLCVAIRAMAPYAERQEAGHVLAYANRQIQPWIEPGDAFSAAMKAKAAASKARREAAE